MFSYYGSKSKVIDLYPAPKHKRIIEPFAGSARYALKYWEHDVLLVDKYHVIVSIWQYLKQASRTDLLSLPKLKHGDKISNYKTLSQVERDFLGFLVIGGVESPRNAVGSFDGVDVEGDLKRIAGQLSKIRHWQIKQLDYAELENEEATWFIDPPYQFGGEYYIHGNKAIDFQSLSQWCKSRDGQVIVCENTKADWLPFYPIGSLSGSKHKTTEAIWMNDLHQPALFQLESQ